MTVKLDCNWLGHVHEFLGLIGLILDWLDTVYRADSYTRHME